MGSKHCHNHLNAARETFVTLFKKRRSEAKSLFTSAQYKIDDNKLNLSNTSNTKDYSWTWFYNKSANKGDSNTEKGNGDDLDDGDLQKKYSKIEKEASPKLLK